MRAYYTVNDELHIVDRSAEGHDGPGWYYWMSDSPEYGSVGAFDSEAEALVHLAECECVTLEALKSGRIAPEWCAK